MTSSTNRLRGIPGTSQKGATGWKSVAAVGRICSCDLLSSPLSPFSGWSISILCNALSYSMIPTCQQKMPLPLPKFPNSPFTVIISPHHLPSTDDYSYLLQPWAQLETCFFNFFCRFTHFSFHIYFAPSHFWFHLISFQSFLLSPTASLLLWVLETSVSPPGFTTTKLLHAKNTGNW